MDDIFGILQVEHINYLKIDCEGAEFNILSTCSRIKDIDVMVIETHAGNFEPLRKHLMISGFWTAGFRDESSNFQAPLIIAFNTLRMQEDFREYYFFDESGTKRTVADLEQVALSAGGGELNYEALCKSLREKKE